jgi:hypothetical protein
MVHIFSKETVIYHNNVITTDKDGGDKFSHFHVVNVRREEPPTEDQINDGVIGGGKRPG